MKKINVIKKYIEYKELFSLRKFKRNNLFTIYFRENEYNKTRVGLSVSKKNGNAVTRNKIKRQVRNILNKKLTYKENYDLVIVISYKYNIDEYSKNEEMLMKLLNTLFSSGANNE